MKLLIVIACQSQANKSDKGKLLWAGSGRQKGKDGLSQILLSFFCGKWGENITREGGEGGLFLSLHSELRWFWPNDLNWASIRGSWEGKEQANPGLGVRLGGSSCFVGSASATAAQQSFLITLNVVSLGGTAVVQCWGNTRQREVYALHVAEIRVRQENDPFGVAFGWLGPSSQT